MSRSLTVDLLKKFPNKYFVETGTNYGGGVQVASYAGFSNIYSIEFDEELYTAIAKRYSEESNIHLYLGDSGKALGPLLEGLDGPSTIFLDAHGVHYNPLIFELAAIKNTNRLDNTILVDDRRVMGMVGTCWENISEEFIIHFLKYINPNYKIFYEDTTNAAKDLIVAQPNTNL